MKYDVDITRVSYSTKTFEVEAADKDSAAELALEMAENDVFDEEDYANYNVDVVYEG